MTTSLLAFSSRKLFRSSKNVSTGCKEQMEVEGGGRGGAGKEDSKGKKKSVRFPYISAFLLGKGTNERQLSRAFPSSVVYTEEGSPKNVPLTKNVLPVKKEGIACCDRCDGKHATDLCPHFPKPRDTSHPDALPSRHRKKLLHNNAFTSSLPGEVYSSSDLLIVRQPGDGSCLFHSLAYGLNDNASSASSLRSLIADFILKNHNYKIADTPLSDWVRWDSNLSPAQYASSISSHGWGGGIEMAILSHIKDINVHVYELSSSSFASIGRTRFRRISAFDHAVEPEKKKTIKVLYGGRNHYDALVLK